MTTGKKTLVLVILSLTLLLLASCDFTPAPTCIPTYDVTKIEDTNDGVCSAADCSLREAINNANACPGPHTINLPAGGYGLTLVGDNEDDGATGDLDLKNDIAIIGTGAPSIHGDGDRVMHIHSGATVTLDGIWITDGRAIVGGGILNDGDL